MLPEQRKRRLLELLQQEGAADVTALSDELAVSSATVRRDLHALEIQGRIRRTHGGAVLPHVSTAFEPHYQEKTGRAANEKRQIAREAVKRVRPGDVVMIDSGSTTLAFARELKHLRDLTVITTDLMVAMEFGDAASITVIIIGGSVRPGFYSVIGPFAQTMLRDLHANQSFLGADAVSLDAGLTNATVEEVPIKRALLARGKHATLLADARKFGKASLAKIADLSEFDEVITDSGLDDTAIEAYADAGVLLTLAR